MGLPKGRTNNKNGRPKGTSNKLNNELRESIISFLQGEFDSIKLSIKELPQKEKVKAYTELLQYGLPKLQSSSLEINEHDLLLRPVFKLPDGTEIEL